MPSTRIEDADSKMCQDVPGYARICEVYSELSGLLVGARDRVYLNMGGGKL